jgi:hypothetical protein
MKHYRFTPKKFLTSVIAPLQFTIGLLLLFGAAGASDMNSMDGLQCIGLGIIGALLMLGTAIYQKTVRRVRHDKASLPGVRRRAVYGFRRGY